MTKSPSEKNRCIECGKSLGAEAAIFCSQKCFRSFDLKKQPYAHKENLRKQKFEDIKRMAFELFCNTLFFDKDEQTFVTGNLEEVWCNAENFYKYAKQKEEEMEK